MAEGRTIQSVSRALYILEAFSGQVKELSVTEISKRLALSKSTAFGLIHTLAEHGYLEQNAENSKYRLGLKLLKLGNIVQMNNIICQKARPCLETLVAEFDETAHLAIQRFSMVVYIDKIESDRTIYINSHIGAENPMYCTGVGKCLLAFMDSEERQRIFNGYKNLEHRTPKTLTSVALLEKDLTLIRERGFSLDDEEFGLGLFCVAVPLFDASGQVVAAISLSGPKAHFDENRSALIARRMQEVTKQISPSL